MANPATAAPEPRLIRLDRGRFDARFPIGPASWPFYDLLWIHSGQVTLQAAGQRLRLCAPDGVLICPGTPFQGAAEPQAEASICHFDWPCPDPEFAGSARLLRPEGPQAELQELLQIQLDQQRRGVASERLQKLLLVVLDGFRPSPRAAVSSRIDLAWSQTEEKLAQVRSLSDVARFCDLSESHFRAAHRAQHGQAAGRHLQMLRLRRAAQLLRSTGMTLAEIAAAVGFAHAESLSAAFRRSYGQSPGQYRRQGRRFA